MSDLAPTLIPIAAGFVLTTVAGGLLGAFLQNRLWRHQWLVQRRSKRQEEARAVFEEVSRLMDKRLFRLSQWLIWMSRRDEERTEYALSQYREMMREWNDSINRTISLIHFYFDRDLREGFDSGVGKKFVELGANVEELYRNRSTPDTAAIQSVSNSIEKLRAEVYEYNLSLLRRLEQMAADAEPKFFSVWHRDQSSSTTSAKQ